MSPAAPHRSYLYAPGHRTDVVAKARRTDADAVIVDLEDAVPAGEKAAARDAVARLAAEAPGDGPVVHVRVNPGDAADLAAAVGPCVEAVRLPKVEHADDVRRADAVLAEREDALGLQVGGIGLHVTIESALGAHRALELLEASPRVLGAAFGATDFLADIGALGARPDGDATLVARGQLVLASRVAGRAAPIDSVHTHLDDDDGLRRSATWARSLGFHGKSVVHPRQLAIVHEVFSPSADEVAWARSIVRALAAADGGARTGDGGARTALVVDGEFIDPAVAARAHAVLRHARAG